MNAAKLAVFEKFSTDALLASLAPGQMRCLKAKQDGTIMDGHHRVCVLRRCGLDVHVLPREVLLAPPEP